MGFHETLSLILNRNRILILCLDENLDKGNQLVYIDFYFVVLFLVKLVFTFHGMSGKLIWTQCESAHVILKQTIR